MSPNVLSVRPFLGAKDFRLSRGFYADLGFREIVLTPVLSLFTMGGAGFYLQDAYSREWLDNSMAFLEVADVGQFWDELQLLQLPGKYEGVRISAVQTFEWGRACYLNDPAGVLWHIGEFSR